MSKNSVLVRIATLMLLLPIPTVGFGMAFNAAPGWGIEQGDTPAVKVVYDLAESIQKEAGRLGEADESTPITELKTVQELPETWTERHIKTGEYRQFFVSEGSTAGEYCVMVKQSYGEDAREGIVYSSASDIINTLSKSDCSDEDFTQIAGPSQVIEPKEEHGAFDEIWPFAIVPGIASFIAAVRILYREPDKSDKVAKTAMSKEQENALRSLLTKRIEAIIHSWSDYETDPVKVIDYPMLANMGFEPTANFHLALVRAKSAYSNKSYDISLMEKTVVELEHNYKVMVSEAKRVKWSSFSEAEQRSLQKAQRLLQIAIDSSSSVHERNAAYRRLLKEIDGILSLPSATTMAIEAKARLHLTSEKA